MSESPPGGRQPAPRPGSSTASTTDTPFPHLFTPFRVGGLDLRNRLVALPTGTSQVVHGIPTLGDVEHVERLAAGGVGLVIAGATVVHPTSALRSAKLVEAYREDVVPAMRAKADAAHRHGAALVGQLVHLGREFIGGESDRAPVAPSAVRTVRDAYPPHALEVAEIDDVVAGWAVSTRHLADAGLDGVEVHAAHGYLVAQFLSPLTNHRSDAFGGPFANRVRFLDLVLDAMRSQSPAGFVLGVRLSGEEEVPGGMDLDDCVRIAEHLAARGDVDYLSITHGTRGTYVKDFSHPDAVAVPSAARVRAASGLPTLVGQRIRDAATAEAVLRTGQADLVGMARALIADPDLPVKSREGRLDEVRSCIGVNQDCRAFDPHLHCAVNAEIGRGRHPGLLRRVDRSRAVYVVGGGPAGLETARVSAERGHRVTVFEGATELGGAVRVAASSPHRAGLMDLVDHLSREVRRLRVDVHLGAEIGADDLGELLGRADHVVLATGSRPAPVPDWLAPHAVATVDDVLLGRLPGASPGVAVVSDASDGFWPAYSAAEALALSGWEVHLVTALTALAPRVPAESAGPLLRRLGAAGVRMHVATQLGPAGAGGGLELRPVFGDDPRAVSPDLVVWHQDRLVTAVPTGAVPAADAARLTAIGDCVSPRRISHAIAEGYRTGATL